MICYPAEPKKNKTNPLFVIALLVCLWLSASCSRPLKEIKVAAEEPVHTMLIAGDSSSFKDKTRERIIEKYRKTCTIHVVDISALNEKTAEGYDVVLIMDTCMAWTFSNPSLKRFLCHEENRKKTVLSMTAGDPGWTYSYKGVDAVTSASRVEKEEDFFNRIDKDIAKVLGVPQDLR